MDGWIVYGCCFQHVAMIGYNKMHVNEEISRDSTLRHRFFDLVFAYLINYSRSIPMNRNTICVLFILLLL